MFEMTDEAVTLVEKEKEEMQKEKYQYVKNACHADSCGKLDVARKEVACKSQALEDENKVFNTKKYEANRVTDDCLFESMCSYVLKVARTL